MNFKSSCIVWTLVHCQGLPMGISAIVFMYLSLGVLDVTVKLKLLLPMATKQGCSANNTINQQNVALEKKK